MKIIFSYDLSRKTMVKLDSVIRLSNEQYECIENQVNNFNNLMYETMPIKKNGSVEPPPSDVIDTDKIATEIDEKKKTLKNNTKNELINNSKNFKLVNLLVSILEDNTNFKSDCIRNNNKQN